MKELKTPEDYTEYRHQIYNEHLRNLEEEEAKKRQEYDSPPLKTLEEVKK